MARKKIGSKKSKRISCGKRYKIEKKVKEHLKKVKKAKDIKIKKGIRGNRKEITVPNNCPFKEDILKKAQEAKEKKEQERQKQKETQKKNREKLVNKKRNLESIVKDAESRAAAYERKNAFVQENAEKLAGKINVESSLKVFFKEVKNVLERSDVVIQVLDARDPLGSRCKQLEEMVIACGKKLILLLNKIDLVPKENVEAWLKYLRNELPALPFKACTQQQTDRLGITKISALTDKDSVKKTSTCLGSDMLLSLLNNYCRSKDIKTSITIGIVGFPNTGKSSIINSLKRSKACNVGSTPGVTKSMQVVQLDKHIKLIDSPGVVMATNLESEEEVILKNCVRIENLEDPVSVVGVIMSKCNKFQLMAIYALPEFNSLDQFLELLAKRYGLLKKGGRGDLNKAAKNVIRDWNGGKITYYSRPPEESTLSGHITTEVVQVMKEAFDIDSLFASEDQLIKGLKKGASNMDSVLSSGKVAEGKVDSDDKEEEDVDMGDDDDEEDDDEEEEESEEDEKMDTAAEPAPKTVVKVGEKKAKKGSKEEDKKVTFSVQLPGNQQLNKVKKQQFKQLKKKRKRSDKISDNLGSVFLSGLSM